MDDTTPKKTTEFRMDPPTDVEFEDRTGKRPFSVALVAAVIICWGLLSLGATVLLFTPEAREFMEASVVPFPIQCAMQVGGALISTICGIAMFFGQNWARWLYVISMVAFATINFVTAPMISAIVPGFILFLILAYVLFRPASEEFFH